MCVWELRQQLKRFEKIIHLNDSCLTMKRTSQIISSLLTISVVLLIGCSNGTGIHNEQAAKDFQPEIDGLKERLAQLESRLTDLEKAAPAPDTKVSGAVVAPPSMTIWSAAAKGNRKEIELHIDAGTDLDSPDNIGQAALHHAAANNHTFIIKLLLANGADANVTDDKGDTALDWAKSWNRTEVADLLSEHRGKTKKELEVEGK